MTNRGYFIPLLALTAALLLSCGAGRKDSGEETAAKAAPARTAAFCADSAYQYVKRQVEFGPRVPGTKAHAACADWLASTLRRHGAEVSEQTATLTTFDGTRIPMRNIFARINPKEPERILLLAHWDTRPWADNDPDQANHSRPLDGANDGASGAAILLETARSAKEAGITKGIDILLCDAEDWGTEGDDDSWALGARHFAGHLPAEGYSPKAAILLDMVGATDATFMREYFSQLSNPALADEIWAIANSLGYADMFPNKMGSAVNDDHVELIKAGIPCIDIIDYRDGQGFFSGWHTMADNIDAISRETLGAVGEVIEAYLKK